MATASKPRRYPAGTIIKQMGLRVDRLTAAQIDALAAMWNRSQPEVVSDAIAQRVAQLSPEERRQFEDLVRSRHDDPPHKRRRPAR